MSLVGRIPSLPMGATAESLLQDVRIMIALLQNDGYRFATYALRFVGVDGVKYEALFDKHAELLAVASYEGDPEFDEAQAFAPGSMLLDEKEKPS